MKTLQQIKDERGKYSGFHDFNEMYINDELTDDCVDVIAKSYAREMVKHHAEKICDEMEDCFDATKEETELIRNAPIELL